MAGWFLIYDERRTWMQGGIGPMLRSDGGGAKHTNDRRAGLARSSTLLVAQLVMLLRTAEVGHKQTYANLQPDVISPLFIMQIPELAPLLEKVEVLKQAPGAEDVYAFVEASVMGAKTPAMGQSACEKVIMMCHPRAWGDRHVPAFSKTWTDWCSYLGDLRDMAASCGQQIHERYAKHR